MKSVLAPEINEVMHAIPYRPAVSIILPFEPKMVAKAELVHALKLAMDKTKISLQENYPMEICNLMQLKLRSLINQLNYTTLKKSVAIFVSPVFEKVLYLDIPVEEKIIIDGSFEIRDLVYSKKELHKYLVLLLSTNGYKVFLGNTTTFVRIISQKPESVMAYINDVSQKVANFSDSGERKEDLMNKFLLHLDKALHLILNANPLPLFVLGTERITGHFNKICKHAKAVAKYIHGNYEDATIEEIREVLQPHIADWKKVKENKLLNTLEAAADDKKLAVGIKEVWKEAMHLKGRLLVVEKNYMVAAERGDDEDEIDMPDEPYNKFSYIKDAVDDIIEKVLDKGGDVEFVDAPLLSSYRHIALVKYY